MTSPEAGIVPRREMRSATQATQHQDTSLTRARPARWRRTPTGRSRGARRGGGGGRATSGGEARQGRGASSAGDTKTGAPETPKGEAQPIMVDDTPNPSGRSRRDINKRKTPSRFDDMAMMTPRSESKRSRTR